MIAAKETGGEAPVRSYDGNTFLYIRHRDIFFVAVTRGNSNAGMSELRATLSNTESLTHFLAAACVFSFLYAMVDIFKGYFEDDFDEDSIRDNFTLVYELVSSFTPVQELLPIFCSCYSDVVFDCYLQCHLISLIFSYSWMRFWTLGIPKIVPLRF